MHLTVTASYVVRAECAASCKPASCYRGKEQVARLGVTKMTALLPATCCVETSGFLSSALSLSVPGCRDNLALTVLSADHMTGNGAAITVSPLYGQLSHTNLTTRRECCLDSNCFLKENK